MTTDTSLQGSYSVQHHDVENDIMCWCQPQAVLSRGLLDIFKALIEPGYDEILLVLAREPMEGMDTCWSYHERGDLAPRDALKNALSALRNQQDYAKRYDPTHIPAMRQFLIDHQPIVTRRDAVAAGNCTAGADKWFRDNGYQDRVTWQQMLDHLEFDRSRMVIWYLWQQHLQNS